MLAQLLRNHILTNLIFLLVLVVGWLSYFQLPREQDPSVNFNWVQVTTVWPGASATDIEKRVTQPLEDGIEKVVDIKFISSSSREGVSNILVRFNDIDKRDFDNRIADLRREIQNKLGNLPDESKQPEINEITSSNAFPTATLLVIGQVYDENLRKTAYNTVKDLERMVEVERVDTVGDTTPELQVHFHPERLIGLGISPIHLGDTVAAYFRDLAAGKLRFGEQEWLVRLVGTNTDPAYLESMPIITAKAELPLGSVAEISRGHEDPRQLVRFNGRPAVLLSIFKKEKANNLEMIDRIHRYIQDRNELSKGGEVELLLMDDQTLSTRQAIGVMEQNALIGLVLVLLVTWFFLGFKIAFFTSLGIAFVLAGTFYLLGMMGETLNSTVLLGIVISLGMLVDDSIVVSEALYHRLQQGMDGIAAAIAALREVATPVLTAVLTTVAAFLPLALMPGVLGDFMRVVPIVVSVALLISLVEAFWLLPSHIVEANTGFTGRTRSQMVRDRLTARLRGLYRKSLVAVLKKAKLGFASIALLLVVAFGMLAGGLVKVDYFATDLFRLFYINIEMPPGTSLNKTLETLQKIENQVRRVIRDEDLRAMTIYAGERFTETEPLIGDEKGQLFISLLPQTGNNRSVNELIEDLRSAVMAVPGPLEVSFLRRKMGPPTSKPINIKVRGDQEWEIREAADAVTSILEGLPGVSDISNDDTKGRIQMSLRLNADAITRAGLNPADIIRIVRLYLDGDVVASMQHEGEKLNVRVRAFPQKIEDVQSFFNQTISLPDGSEIALGALLESESRAATSNIRHYDLRRTITVEADIDSSITDTVATNQALLKKWHVVADEFPGISLDITGELDDIKESLGAMVILFAMGLGLIFLILGTQFKSYIQPLLILAVVPTAFIGVIFGLFFSGNPLSLYTLYGIIALAGISANDAIVLVSTANSRLYSGSSTAYAIVSAARRRVVPIIITSLTTMAGLFSLAAGLGGESLMWGPVATVIVWGLGFSTLLTLFFVPLLYVTLIKEAKEEALIPLPPFSRQLALSEKAQVFLKLKSMFGRKDQRHWSLGSTSKVDGKYADLYDEGVAALRDGSSELAIRCFEELTGYAPDNVLFCTCAAQAHILYQTINGWDIGYAARAERFLSRAKMLEPDAPQLIYLEKALKAIVKKRTD